MHWIALLLAAIILAKAKRKWSAPTDDDKKWADEHEDLIRRNS